MMQALAAPAYQVYVGVVSLLLWQSVTVQL